MLAFTIVVAYLGLTGTIVKFGEKVGTGFWSTLLVCLFGTPLSGLFYVLVHVAGTQDLKK